MSIWQLDLCSCCLHKKLSYWLRAASGPPTKQGLPLPGSIHLPHESASATEEAFWMKRQTSFNDKEQSCLRLDHWCHSHIGLQWWNIPYILITPSVVRKYIGNTVKDNFSAFWWLWNVEPIICKTKKSSLDGMPGLIKVYQIFSLPLVEDRRWPVLGYNVPSCLTEVERSLQCCSSFFLQRGNVFWWNWPHYSIHADTNFIYEPAVRLLFVAVVDLRQSGPISFSWK